MSKEKTNTNNEAENIKPEVEIEQVITAEIVKPVEVATVAEGSEEIVLPGDAPQVEAAKESIKINILNVGKSEPAKEPKKINIVDVSKKTTEKKSNKHKVLGIPHPFKDKIDLFNVMLDEKEIEKVFEPLIYVGGGMIAATNVASKALASIGSYLIKK